MNSLQANQAYIFLLFILNGILIGVLFDLFRIFRKSFKTSDIITYVQDVLFWILTGVMTLYFLFVFNDGELRLYIFLGILLGVSIYLLTISKYVIEICVKVITMIKNIVMKILEIIIYPIRLIERILKRIFFRPFSFVFINIRKIFAKTMSNMQNSIKKLQKSSKKEGMKKDF